jgi:TolB-like protein
MNNEARYCLSHSKSLKGVPVKSKPIFLFLFLAFVLVLPASSFSQNQTTKKGVKVAILPFTIRSQENLGFLREGIMDILTSRITEEGTVEAVKRSVVQQILDDEKSNRLDEAAVKMIGMRVGADYIVSGNITKTGDDITLNGRLIRITEDKPLIIIDTQQKGLDSVMMKIGDFGRDIRNKIVGSGITAGRTFEYRGPSITHAFVVKKINYGDVLKVYVEAECPEGEMFRIGTEVVQSGYGRYPTSWVYVKAADQRHFKGYLQWNTFSSKTPNLTDGTLITLTVFVHDKYGYKSEEISFPITFASGGKGASSEAPPPFDQKDVKKLGSIDIELMDLTIWQK